MPDKEDGRGALTQQVFRAVCVVVVVIREMVDSVTAALIDACGTKTTTKMYATRTAQPANRRIQRMHESPF